MQSLGDILSRKNLDEPTEITALREYVQNKHQSSSSIKIVRGCIILTVPSASLATTLRFEQNKIKAYCQLTRKLVIRISY